MAVGAALLLVLFVSGLAFANSISAARVAENARALHWANATLGTSSLTRAAVVQAITFAQLESEGLAEHDDVVYAMDQVEVSYRELKELEEVAGDSESAAELTHFLAPLDSAVSMIRDGNARGWITDRTLDDRGSRRHGSRDQSDRSLTKFLRSHLDETGLVAPGQRRFEREAFFHAKRVEVHVGHFSDLAPRHRYHHTVWRDEGPNIEFGIRNKIGVLVELQCECRRDIWTFRLQTEPERDVGAPAGSPGSAGWFVKVGPRERSLTQTTCSH